MKKISGAEYPLSKIFSSDFEFIIPPYQRPYAWKSEQALEMFDDLLSFMQMDENNNEGYFLGSIVIVKNESNPFSEVIDGQQRLTTLTILLSAAGCAHEGENKEEVKPYIIEPGKKMEGIKAKPRLSLRERDQGFFYEYIQTMNHEKILSLESLNIEEEPQQNIRDNYVDILEKIHEMLPTPDDVAKFVKFILTRCYIVAVSTPSHDSAFRVFSVMNSRGLDLQPTDIIKAEIIGKLKDEKDRKDYSNKWDDIEIRLGRSNFNELFSHIRMIYKKEKLQKTIIQEFKDSIITRNMDPKDFIDNIISSYANIFINIKIDQFNIGKNAEKIRFYLRWLNKIDDSDWIPPTMLFIMKNKDNEKAMLDFFVRMERLAAFMYICKYTATERIAGYSQILKDIENTSYDDGFYDLEFDKTMIDEFKNSLNDDVYKLSSGKRKYIILRLDSFISDGAATYETKDFTIEHVLPQTVDDDSEWAEWWPDEKDRKEWVNKIANLVPLNRKKNSAAQNFPFLEKRDTYFSGEDNVSSYALTSQIIKEKDWKLPYLKTRQKNLVRKMLSGWGLK